MKIQNLLEHRENIVLLESFGLAKDDYNIQWMTEVHPLLMEVALAPDQVKQLLKSVETTAGEMGQNRTLAGKAVDTAGEVSEKVKDLWFNKLGGALQKSSTVQGFDAKWEEIKAKVAAENPKLASALSKYKEFADNNPKLQKFLLMIAASVAGSLGLAVAGGAAAGIAATGLGVGAGVAIVNIADRLLKNEKLSTAVGRGATAGIVAGLSAAGVKAVSTMFNSITDAIRDGDQYHNVMMGNPPVKVRISAEDGQMLSDLHNKAVAEMGGRSIQDAMASGGATPGLDKWLEASAEVANKATDPAYQQAISDAVGSGLAKDVAIDVLQVNAEKAAQSLAPMVGALAGQKAGAAGEKKESYYTQARPLSEGQVYLLLKRVSQQEQLTEGPVWDKVKSGAGAVAGAALKGAGAVTKQITNKNTYEKLWASWKLEGSPTDSEALAKFLKGQGVSDEVVTKVYGDMKIPAPGSAPAAAGVDIETVKQMLAKLPVDRKARLLTYLLGGKKAAGKAPAAAPEENPNIVKGTESKVHKGQKL